VLAISKLFTSCAPDLVQDGDQDQHQTVPNKQDLLQTIVSDGRSIIFGVWIAIEKLVPPAEYGNASKQKDDYGESECDAQRRNASLFNHRNYKGTARFHGKRVPVLSIGCYDASVGFSNDSKGGVATPS
jgi:hypothetical protein